MKHKDHRNVTHGEARKTALLVSAVLIIASAVFWYRGSVTTPLVLVSIAVILSFTGFFVPQFAKLFHRGWMHFAFALGYVNSRILLTLIYFLMFVPYGILSRIFRRDPLQIRKPRSETYWNRREVTRQTKEQFERLF
ncbi:MAG: SxtJ family membrane protein [Pyrinomonadaceae bacterium]